MELEKTKLRIAGIVAESFVDGPGIRFAIFTQGCHHNCPGCQNPQTHSFDGGHFISLTEILDMISENPMLDGVTFSGGDPMCQAKELVPLAREIKERGMNLVVYTGYTYEHMMELVPEKPEFLELLSFTDLLVDGPFIMAQRSLDLEFRGSLNQRLVDVQESLAQGHVVLHRIQLDEMAEHPERFS
ncbi:MAG: anaerobic ribonucleoside-triphosphate reductase activating protein [Fibrobacteraceae bacterium]|nr:anaerobic ribonucleoside-triphosphate reductase activating protein [Fibrobacteraceae bacterium]